MRRSRRRFTTATVLRMPAALRMPTVLCVSAVALAGCTGIPLTRAHVSPSPVHPPTTTTVSLPQPPRELRLDRVDPCTVLTPAQRAQLSLDTTPDRYTDAALGNARACSVRGTHSGTVARLALVTTEDVTVWLDDTAQVTATPMSVGGFPALQVRTPGLDEACNVEVGVAHGQFLDVLFRDGGNATPLPQNALCAGADRVAEAAIASLAHSH